MDYKGLWAQLVQEVNQDRKENEVSLAKRDQLDL